MNRKSLPLLLSIIFAVAAQAQTSTDGWNKFTSDAGKFSALFPGQPEEGAPAEKGIVLHTFRVVARPRIYMVLYSDYPDADLTLDTKTRLRAERDGFIKGAAEGKLIAEREFKFKRGSTELPALEFASEGDGINYKSIVIIDGRRVYFVCAGGLKGSDSTSQIERFLGSFELK
jgi:hypothetical protein